MKLYRTVQSPPTEPGWYYARVRDMADIRPVYVGNDYEYPGLWIEWGPALMPLTRAAWFGPVDEVVEVE